MSTRVSFPRQVHVSVVISMYVCYVGGLATENKLVDVELLFGLTHKEPDRYWPAVSGLSGGFPDVALLYLNLSGSRGVQILRIFFPSTLAFSFRGMRRRHLRATSK